MLGYKSSAAILANAGLGGLTVLVTIIMLVFVVDRVGLLGAGTGTVFFIFAGIAVLACAFAIRWIPETRARTLEQIEGDLALSTTREEVVAHGM